MTYSPQEALAVALYNSEDFSSLASCHTFAGKTLVRLREMGFELVDVNHTHDIVRAREIVDGLNL